MTRRFELTRVALLNFRSIADCDVHVGPLNLLVGPNGSGKSNFLDALQFVADALNGGIESAVRTRSGIALVRRRTADASQVMSVELDMSAGAGSIATFRLSVLGAGSDLKVEEYCRVVDRESGAVRLEFSRDGDSLVGSQAFSLPPPDSLVLTAERFRPELAPLFGGLAGYTTYAINPAAMRSPRALSGVDSLARDGANVASVLDRLAQRDREAFDDIEKYLGVIVPGVTGVRSVTLGGYEVFQVLQAVAEGGHTSAFPASAVSDGTLRALGVLAAALAPGVNDNSPPVGVEEPESNLHPAAAGVLMEALRVASEDRQVFATTHSPDLLDSPEVRAEEVLAVRVVDGVSVIAAVDAAGRDAIGADLFTAGELLRADQLFPEGYPTASQARR